MQVSPSVRPVSSSSSDPCTGSSFSGVSHVKSSSGVRAACSFSSGCPDSSSAGVCSVSLLPGVFHVRLSSGFRPVNSLSGVFPVSGVHFVSSF